MNWDWSEHLWRWGLWESMQPGPFTGTESVDCPYCGTSLELTVYHRYGSDQYACCECDGVFEVNWAEGRISYDTN